MELVVDKLIDFSGGKDEELRDISSLGEPYSRVVDEETRSLYNAQL